MSNLYYGLFNQKKLKGVLAFKKSLNYVCVILIHPLIIPLPAGQFLIINPA